LGAFVVGEARAELRGRHCPARTGYFVRSSRWTAPASRTVVQTCVLHLLFPAMRFVSHGARKATHPGYISPTPMAACLVIALARSRVHYYK
jgi:hypothetical protein